MKKIFLFFIILFLIKDSYSINGYWQCKLENNICVSTCVGNLDGCFNYELCNCVNTNQLYPQKSEQASIPEEVQFQLNANELNSLQTNSKVYLEINTNKPSRIEMVDNTKNVLICKKCSSYKGYKSFKEGSHKILIKATDKDNNIKFHESNILVDTKKPKIIKTFPKNKQKTSSYIFSVLYSEANLKEVVLYFRQENEDKSNFIKRSDCSSSSQGNKYPICEFDLSNYLHPGKVIFNFKISDQKFKTSLKKEQTAILS